ncbi:hypothetical protein EMCRGX_G021204 [Ephydatia muelleri]
MLAIAAMQIGDCDWLVESVIFSHPTDSTCQGSGYVGSCRGMCLSSAQPRLYDSRDAVLQAYNPFETDCKCCQPKIESAFECGCATCKP